MESREKYNQLDAEIQQMLKTINIKLEEHKADHVKRPGNWSLVGDLDYVREQLQQIDSFLK
jgi:hypothetical protein